MYKIIASMFVGMALSACGGTNSSYANLSTVVTNFSDGSGVAIARFPVNRSYAYVNEVMLINDINDANRIADGLQRANNGQLILVVPDRIPGSYYAERSQGLSSFGEDVDLIYEGKSLDGRSLHSPSRLLCSAAACHESTSSEGEQKNLCKWPLL